MKQQLYDKILAILDIPTFETRGRDSLDFHEIGIGTLKDIIDIAYDAGVQSTLQTEDK